MPRRTRARATNVDQLGLGLRGEGFEGPFEARGVFSTAYLTRHLRNAQKFAAVHDVEQVFREIGEIWRARVTALSTLPAGDFLTGPFLPTVRIGDFIPTGQLSALTSPSISCETVSSVPWRNFAHFSRSSARSRSNATSTAHAFSTACGSNRSVS